MAHRWLIYDPVLATTTTWTLNPSGQGGPNFDKTITYQKTTAPDGLTLVFEGQDAPQAFEWNGAILTQAHYEQWVEWFETRRQLRLTDDLGRVFWVYITSFKPTRKRSAQYPWRHEFTAAATIIDWAS